MLIIAAALVAALSCNSDARYDAAARLLKQARATPDLVHAAALADEGLARLDFGYSKNPVTHHQVTVIDDTGQLLALADWQQHHGELGAAVREKERVLSDRLEIFHEALCGQY